MPYKSEAQRRYLHAKEPALAKKWDKKYGGKVEKNYTPIFKSANPDFNYRAAQKAYDLVMKMDDDSAEMFVHLVTSEVTEETIQKNLRLLQGHLNKVAKRRMERVRKALIKKALENPEMAQPYAQAFADIAKAGKKRAQHNPYDYGYRFRESDFNRDPATGRFRTEVKATQSKPLPKKTAESLNLPTKEDANKISSRKKNLSLEEVAHFQDEYRQLVNFLGAVASSSSQPGDTDVIAHIKNKRNNQVYTVTTSSTRPDSGLWDPAKENLVGLDARPKNLTLGGAAFGLQGALGYPTTQGSRGMAEGFNLADEKLRAGFVDDWQASMDPNNPNLRTYNRIKMGSELVGEFAPPGSKAQMAARFGQFAGEHGPEAEKVIGPSARKTAYRYRGTSKKPDSELLLNYNAALRSAKRVTLVEGGEARSKRRAAQTRAMNKYLEEEAKRTGKPMDAIRVSDTKRAEIMNAAAKTATVRTGYTDEEIGAGRSVVADHLWSANRRPRGELYNLQLASGTTPPSEGVLIDKTGKIVDQAVGYGDDHYLPFNLKNLKALRGGEYIRTRSVGGPTSEDIYTGLMTGAKKLTVISRSGTFTVNFEPDFRGKRRYNDKALRMTRRYEQLLDAVQSEQVDRVTLSQNIKNGIIAEVRADYPGESPAALNKLVKDRIKEFTENPELSEKDERLAQFMAQQRAQGSQGQDADTFIRQVENEIAREKEYKFRLNGPGYAAALDSLREQFPYYITVDHITSREHEEHLASDKGYVEPGRNRPTAAQGVGLFGTEIHQGAKRQGLRASTASGMHYQEIKGERRLGLQPTTAPKKTEPGKEGEGTTENGEKKTPETEEDKAIKQAAQRKGQREAAQTVYREIKKLPPEAYAGLSMMELGEAEFMSKIGKPDGVKEFNDKVIAALEEKKKELPLSLKQAMERYQESSELPTDFSPELALVWPRVPYPFGGVAYKKSDDPDVIKARANEVRRINERSKSLTFGGNLSSLTPQQMEREVNDLAEVYRLIKDHPGMAGDDKKGMDSRKRLREMFLKDYDPEAVNLLLRNPKKIERRMEDVHRMRLLLQLGGWTPDEVAQHTGRAPDAVRPHAEGVRPASGPILGTPEPPFNPKKELEDRIGDLEATVREHPSYKEAYDMLNNAKSLAGDFADGAVEGAEVKVFLEESQKAVRPDLSTLDTQQRGLYRARPEWFEVKGRKITYKGKPQ